MPRVERVVNNTPAVRRIVSRFIAGDTLDIDKIHASYNAGVLALRIPVAEKAKPRKITIELGDASTHELGAKREQQTIDA